MKKERNTKVDEMNSTSAGNAKSRKKSVDESSLTKRKKGESYLPVDEQQRDNTEVEKQSKGKTISVKKLPRMFRKRYTERSFHRKISRHIYIAKDREFVQSFFKPVADAKKPSVSIPSGTLCTRQDAARFKQLAKQIKKQKGRVKWVPLLAFVGSVVAIVFVLVMFKDVLIKKGMQSGLQAAFGAKCDIAYVHLGLMDSSFTVRGLAVADKDNTMTNLFEVGNITMDFDLVQLLKKRFVAENLDVSDIRLGTPRETDGALPPKPKKEEKEPSEFQLQLASFMSEKTEVLETSITGIFEQYNPENLIENFYAQLSSPEIVEKAEEQIAGIIPKWQSVPAELSASVTKVISDGQDAADFNWGAVKSDPVRLKEGIKLVTATLENVNALQKQTEATLSMLKSDTSTVQSLSSQVQKAVQADYKLVSAEINKIASFSIKDDGMKIITSSFDTIVADLLGKYYPVLQEGIAYAKQLSAKSATSSASSSGKTEKKKEEKQEVSRYAGRTIEYRNDKTPSFLIQRVHGSGAGDDFAIDVTLTDISNDMDKWGSPVAIQGSAVHGGMSDTISGSFDLRTTRPGDMLELGYNGSGYSVALALPEDETVAGVPAAAGTGAFSARLTANEDGGFSIGGTVLLDPVHFTVDAFEPAFAFDLYNRALAKFNSVKAGVSVAYSSVAGLDIGISSDIDRRFVQVLTELFNEELGVIKEQATVKVKETLDAATASFTEKFGDFNDIRSSIEAQAAKLDEFKAELERKKTDAENQLKAAADSAVQKATDEAKSKAESAVDSAKESAKDALKGLFSR